MRLFLYFFVVSAFTFWGCRTTKQTNLPSNKTVVSIKHGTSFGHCRGYCRKSEETSVNQIRYTEAANDTTDLPTTRSSQFFSKHEFDELVYKIDWQKWEALPEIIGCPDCADGGAEYIEINTGKALKRVTFDSHSNPGGLEKILDYFRSKRLDRNRILENNGK